jgi:hypothetical protein
MKKFGARSDLPRGAIFGAISWTLACSPLTAALTNVYIYPQQFYPTTVTINVNDGVMWTWLSYFHSTTSNDWLWDSGEYGTWHTFTITNIFTSPGTFPYYCTYHLFTGSVIVQGVGLRPTVTITNPLDGAVLSAPASLVLKATAASSAGSVTNVRFFQGTTPLGSVVTIPYSIPVSGLAAGNYAFSAVAADNLGLTATNSITVHVITPVPLTLSGARWFPGTGFQFSYTADPGLSYLVQRSGDLRNWIGLQTNSATSNPVVVLDPNASRTADFYRVGRLPNP